MSNIVDLDHNPKRIRFILSGLADPAEPIRNFRLVAASRLDVKYHHTALRVVLPVDLELTKYSCDPYSTTEDQRTLRQLSAIPIVKVNGKWIAMQDLWPAYPPHRWHEVLRTKGLYGTLSARGYLRQEQYAKYLESKQEGISV